jgi:hypothetical protein
VCHKFFFRREKLSASKKCFVCCESKKEKIFSPSPTQTRFSFATPCPLSAKVEKQNLRSTQTCAGGFFRGPCFDADDGDDALCAAPIAAAAAAAPMVATTAIFFFCAHAIVACRADLSRHNPRARPS